MDARFLFPTAKRNPGTDRHFLAVRSQPIGANERDRLDEEDKKPIWQQSNKKACAPNGARAFLASGPSAVYAIPPAMQREVRGTEDLDAVDLGRVSPPS